MLILVWSDPKLMILIIVINARESIDAGDISYAQKFTCLAIIVNTR